MNIRQILGVFSRRKVAGQVLAPLPKAFRTRVLMLCNDRFGPRTRRLSDFHSDYRPELWNEMHRRLSFLVGRPRLSPGSSGSPAEDLNQFLWACSDEHFLSFVESLFQVDCYGRSCTDENDLVDDQPTLVG